MDPNPLQLIICLIIPVQRPMMHLRPGGPKLPPKLQLHPLHQMRGNLQVSNIRGMPLRRDIVVLQDPRRVEVMDEPLLLVMLVNSLDLIYPYRALYVCIS
jgi:hypothetical protein